MSYRVLIVEDDELIGEMIQLNLEGEGFQTRWVKAGDIVVDAVKGDAFDCIVLDLMLPGKNGFEVAEALRMAEIGTPILMLTARSETVSKVQGLDAGADDYLTKPFEMPEFLARVRALIRRSLGKRELPSNKTATIGRFCVNFETRESESREGPITLSEKEAELLNLFVKSPHETLRRADILEEVWGMDQSPTERTVDNFIVRLRKLYEENPEAPKHFITVRAQGYRYNP